MTCGTVFHGTKIVLQKWFLTISLIGNAKKSLSTYQLARDLDLDQKTAWYLMQRIRAEIAKKGRVLLKGIIEADEVYIGGNPESRTSLKTTNPPKRGQRTQKTPVLGAVERGRKVVAQVAEDLTGRGILKFIRSVPRIFLVGIIYSPWIW